MTSFSMASRYAVRNQPLTIHQLAQSILDEAMRQPDALEKLPAAVRERIEQLRGNDHDPGGPSGPTSPDSSFTNRFVEARNDIPKSTPASTVTVRTVEKEILKEVHTHLPQSEVQVFESDVPICFRQLPQDQQQILMARLRGLALEYRKAVLEWDARCLCIA